MRRNLAGTISNPRLCWDLLTLAITSNATLHKRHANRSACNTGFKFHLTLHPGLGLCAYLAREETGATRRYF